MGVFFILLEQQADQLRAQAQQQTDLQLIIGRLEEFSAKVKDGLEQCDWHGCRELIRSDPFFAFSAFSGTDSFCLGG